MKKKKQLFEIVYLNLISKLETDDFPKLVYFNFLFYNANLIKKRAQNKIAPAFAKVNKVIQADDKF